MRPYTKPRWLPRVANNTVLFILLYQLKYFFSNKRKKIMGFIIN